MNKIVIFSGILLILFFVFACTLPSEIQVTGSPSLEFSANMNFGDCFTDMVENVMNADGKTKTLPCTNPSINYLTFVLRMDIFHKDDYQIDASGVTGTDNITIDDKNVEVSVTDHETYKIVNDTPIAESDEPYNMSFKGLEDYLEGFEFQGIKSKIYFYGTQLVEVSGIELNRLMPDGSKKPLIEKEKSDTLDKTPSGVKDIEEFTDLTLPPGGNDIDITDIINTGGDLTLNYKVYLLKDKEIDEDWIDITHTITAELIIWLPMTFVSIEENAVFKFPTFFDGISDVIKSLAKTGYVDKMDIKMTMDPINPFSNGNFIMNDKAYGDIESPLDKDSFLIILNEKEVEYIKDNPFEPSFFVLYPKKNSLLEIPKENIMVTTVLIDAGLNYNAEF